MEPQNKPQPESAASRRDREDVAVNRLLSLVESLRFSPPEGVARLLAKAQRLLNHHFGESVARADAAYVAEILRKVERRREGDPAFEVALEEALSKQESDV